MITRRQNLLRTLGHQEPDWVPIVTLADGYNRPAHMPDWYDRRIQEVSPSRALAEYFDVTVLERYNAAWTAAYTDVRYTTREEDKVTIERWETPHGTLTRRVRRIEYPQPGDEPPLATLFPIEHPVKSVDDFPAFQDVMEDVEYVVDAEAVAQVVADVGDSGVITLGAPSTPVGMCVRLYTGVETLALAYKQHPAELRRMLEAMADSYARCYAALATTAADGVINYDDTTTNAISPAMFRELELPFLRRSADIMHARGKLLIHHACGHVLDLLPDFGESGLDAFDGPAAPPVANTTVGQARQRLGDAPITIMPFTEEYAMRSHNPRRVRDAIRTMFTEAARPTDFVVNLVAPPGGAIESLWLAIDEAKRLSRTCAW